uniref:Uncharacterized protein n=1 Tax=Ciona intestinalis TaxID=7719 RepID=H2XKY0_CIOIN
RERALTFHKFCPTYHSTKQDIVHFVEVLSNPNRLELHRKNSELIRTSPMIITSCIVCYLRKNQ